MKLKKTGAARRNNVDPKGKGKLREDSFTRSKNLRGQPKRPPTGRRQRNAAAHKTRQEWKRKGSNE